MKGDAPPDTDHLVRYIKPSNIEEDGTVSSVEFRLRPGETGISCNWLEAFAGDKRRQLAEVRRLCRIKVRKTGDFAELHLGTVRSNAARRLVTLRIIHAPLAATDGFEADPSHAEIMYQSQTNPARAAIIVEVIARSVINMHPATSAA